MNGLTLTEHELYKRLELTQPCHPGSLLPETIAYFDKDGFELTPLEQELYRNHGIFIGEHLRHACNQIDWFVQHPRPNKGILLDHSMLLHRFGVGGPLREQIKRYAEIYPELNKLLLIKPKWGIDFSIDYVTEDDVVEVFHTEYTSRNRADVQRAKVVLEKQIKTTDWEDVAKTLVARRGEWESLKGMDQIDWKARFLGLPQAESLEKSW